MANQSSLTPDHVLWVNNIVYHSWELSLAYEEMCAFTVQEANTKLEELIISILFISRQHSFTYLMNLGIITKG